MTPEEFKHAPSEVARYRHLVAKYCEGPGLDVASQGDPVVPWAWSLELPEAEFAHYNSNNPPKGAIQLRGHAQNLGMIGDESLGFLCASHLLEDYIDWTPVLEEWKRVLRIGGRLIILCPEKHLWNAYVKISGKPNCMHRREPVLGEISYECEKIGLKTVEEYLSNLCEGDYTIVYVGVRV